jgi:hypothetical protein
MTARHAAIAKKHGSTIDVAHDDIHIAVVEQITHGQTAGNTPFS